MGEGRWGRTTQPSGPLLGSKLASFSNCFQPWRRGPPRRARSDRHLNWPSFDATGRATRALAQRASPPTPIEPPGV
eukprot:869384-Pyramimonas_sp.AAC.1